MCAISSDKEHTLALMKKHAAILGPKFKCVLSHLNEEISPLGIAQWQEPKGGYFVSVYTLPGLCQAHAGAVQGGRRRHDRRRRDLPLRC